MLRYFSKCYIITSDILLQWMDGGASLASGVHSPSARCRVVADISQERELENAAPPNRSMAARIVKGRQWREMKEGAIHIHAQVIM